MYRSLFIAAATYNLAFGLWAGLFPLSFFTLFDLPPPLYPAIWSCLGMVVGLYGPIYAYVAWRPERGDFLIWIGLIGKILGPIGWLLTVHRGELPPRTFPLILANDLIWWYPFLFYLLRNRRERTLIFTGLVIAIHLAACMALLAVQGGTEMGSNMEERAHWVASHVSLWTACWLIWALASMSLVAFFAIWTMGLLERGASSAIALSACAIGSAGVLFDLAGECVNIMRLTEPGVSVEQFAAAARLYGVLGPGIANGLYCLAGLLLSVLSWRVGLLRDGVGVLGLVMWSIGLVLTIFAFIDFHSGMVVTGAAVMLLFIPWAALTGWRLR